MGHSVHLIIGKGSAITAFLMQWPAARAVDLRGSWQAIPVDEVLYVAIEAKYPGAIRPSGLGASPLGLSEALAEATAQGGGLAYVETDYFGGTGGQAAIAFVEAHEVVAPQTAKGSGPINQALRRIGVTRAEADDEFDTIGLGERRTMTDYELEGPVRLRGETVLARPEQAAQRFIPMWVVMLVIAAAVGVAIMVSVAR